MNAYSVVANLLEADTIDPDSPEEARGELTRMFPTRTVTFKGNSMLSAGGIIRGMQASYRSRKKSDKDYAMRVIQSWPGLSDEEYRAILSGNADIVDDGDNAVITIRLWKK